ncbi:DMT family transporter [Enterovirga rhinocerotis]|uniref:EamA-like transporter family protein n=1 Tax=Enterovirga rhinocerotis TaxID=1339210 RepID=A0A4R7BQX8_9HYPH|nr:EamA family transporter [Enterovirga rhinocerotis]TDR88038.1 EamA-like transporter family protein [Enterovirga rhinocerotis]
MIRNLLLVASLGLCWGFNWVAVKLALAEIPPWTLRAVGFSLATAIMFGVLFATGTSPRVPRRHWFRLAIVGVLSIAAYNIFSAFAQLTATTSRAAVLSYMMPIWAVIFARIVLGEPFDRRRQIGLALGGAGLIALGLPLLRSGELSIGLLFAILSGVFWAMGSVVLKRWPVDASAPVITTWQLGLAAILTGIGMLIFEGVPTALPQLPSTWAGLAYNVLIGQALASTLWFVILGRMPAGIATIGSLLVPGVGVIGATLILGERPTMWDWLGLLLIVAAAASVLLARPVVPPAAGKPA